MRNIVEKIHADVRRPADTGPEGALAVAERTRLARELHDSFPQEFQAIILQLRLALLGASDPEVRLHVMNALRAAEAGLDKTREHIVSLREPGRRPAHARPPRWPAWDELVAGAARVALTEYGRALEVALAAPDVRVAPALGTEVAAIVSEAVRNAARHGGVPVIGCNTYLTGELVAAEICDQGAGMPPAMAAHHRFGICGMRERAARIGAAFELHSRPDSGTSVYIALRLSHSGVWPKGMRC